MNYRRFASLTRRLRIIGRFHRPWQISAPQVSPDFKFVAANWILPTTRDYKSHAAERETPSAPSGLVPLRGGTVLASAWQNKGKREGNLLFSTRFRLKKCMSSKEVPGVTSRSLSCRLRCKCRVAGRSGSWRFRALSRRPPCKRPPAGHRLRPSRRRCRFPRRRTTACAR